MENPSSSSLKLVFILSLLLVFSESYSQEYKFGKISKQDLELTHYLEKYPEQPAVMIADVADCGFHFNAAKERFQFVFEHKRRMMILNEQGTSLGDFAIPFYSSGTNSEKISRFSANVYYFDGNKVQQEKIRERDGFINEKGNNWYELKFALPNVGPGAIIEVEYTITSDYLEQLRNWQFQYSFPVEHSQYSLRLISLFKYRKYFQGFINLDVDQVRPNRETFQISQHSSSGATYGSKTFNATFDTNEYLWVARDVPAFQSEPFTNNVRNYLASMNFELVAELWPNQEPRNYTENWEDVSRVIYEAETFGKFFNSAHTVVYNNIRLDREKERGELLEQALKAIREKIRWNNRSGMWARQTAPEVFQSGQGNSAEINLMLCALLRNSGIEANPVLLSTRSNGMIFSDLPTLFQFNYLIVAVPDGHGNHLLLDATDPYLPAGYIPQRAVNGRGRIITPRDSQWVTLENHGLHSVNKTYRMQLDHKGNLSGTLEYLYHDLARHQINQQLQTEGNNGLFKEMEIHLKSSIAEPAINIPEDLTKPVRLTGTFEINEMVTKVGNELYLPLLLFETIKESTFNQEERLYPVHFDQKELTRVSIIIQLPEDIKVVHLPENQIIRWGDNMIYEFSAAHQEGILILKAERLIAIPQVLAKDYPYVKKFFDQVLQKCQEQIVLSAGSI